MRLPLPSEIEQAYQILLHAQPRSPGVSDLSKYSQWARLDPRLAEIWVAYVSRHWEKINPSELKRCVQQEQWPSATALLLEFVREGSSSRVLPHWCRVITAGTKRADGEQFFVGLRRFGGEAMFEDAVFSMDEYRKWGFLSRENLLRLSASGCRSKAHREEVLRRLLLQKPRITVNDYWNTIGKSISKRQAERDLQKSSLLRRQGQTKGRSYSRKHRR